MLMITESATHPIRNGQLKVALGSSIKLL